jgi:DNA-binding transcriptional ArsR family regulator
MPRAETPVPDRCEVELVHPDRVDVVIRARPNAGALDRMAEIFHACSGGTRLLLLLALAEAELCVCDLAATVDASPSGVSHHLSMLRALRLVQARRDGRMIYYRLDDEHVRDLLSLARVHAEHQD